MNSTTLKGALQKITLPHKMVDKYKKAVLKKEIKKHQSVRKYKGQVVISCRKKELNHYQGQTYSNFSPHHLASYGWRNNKAKGDYFTINATKGNPALKVEDEVSSFSQLGILQNISDVLKGYDIHKPTDIQAQCIPHLLNGNNVMGIAETGSGKTLSFLLPLVQKILKEKQKGLYEQTPNTPFGIILVPSRELADQIHMVAVDLIRSLDMYCMCVCGGRGTQKILKYRPQHMMDIVVATPGVLSKILTNKIYSLNQLSYIVLDEVDTLMDDSFNSKTIRIIKKLSQACGSLGSESSHFGRSSQDGQVEENEELTGVQMVMSGATVPRSLQTIVEDTIPLETFIEVKTDNVHKIMPHVPHKFHRTINPDKPEILLKQLKQNMKQRIPTMVFCNRTSTLLFLENLLESAGVECIAMHAQMTQKKREGIFQRFQAGESDILLCTDIASRGLDTVRVQHVINYEFPLFMSDYIHRSGRVGRVGSHGAGFVLSYISNKWDIDLLWQIEAAVRRTKDLHNVNANIKRKITGLIKEKYQENLDIS